MSEYQDLLIEIGTEELPPKSLAKLSLAFAEIVGRLLNEAQLDYEEVLPYATPRRLALIVKNLSIAQADSEIEKRGPTLQAAFDEHQQPTPACIGFARSCGLTPEQMGQLTTLKTDKGEWVIYKQHQPGQKTTELLIELLQQALKQLPIPKTMRWSDQSYRFIRPVHWCLVLFGDQVVTGHIFGLETGNETYGHRFHANQPFKISSPRIYEKTLNESAFVIANFAKRREQIVTQAQEVLARSAWSHGQVLINPGLLDEVTSIVEWPVALLAEFDPAFLKVPTEVLTAVMQEHQKYFPIQDASGQLLPCFITIANIASKQPERVIAGNQRVIRARLADAVFFYETDINQTLEKRREALKHIVFQNKLGSLFDKTERIAPLAQLIAEQIGCNTAQAVRAAQLSKSDLVTEMVGEFPELQGIMGRYYAEHDGEDPVVAEAMAQHYQPRFASDDVPLNDVACAVAIADRIDTLIGIFALKKYPTGDKDPFGLRRAALGVIRICLEKKYNLDIKYLLEKALAQYPSELHHYELLDKALQFIMERLRAWYHEQGVAMNLITAVMAKHPTHFVDFDKRLQALQQFIQLPQAMALAEANKRVNNILKKQSFNPNIKLEKAVLDEQAEHDLAEQIERQKNIVTLLYAEAKYIEALSSLAQLQQPLEHFFTEVMVMVEDEKIRNNRLALLNSLRELFLGVADISLLSAS